MPTRLCGSKALIEFGRQLGVALAILADQPRKKEPNIVVRLRRGKARQCGEILLKIVIK